MKKYLLFLVAGILAFSPSAKAQCSSHNPITSINYEIKPVSYNRDYSVEELTSTHSSEPQRRKSTVMGSSNGDVEIRVDATFRAEPFKNKMNQYCLNVKTVRATIYLLPKVHIAENFGRGTCEYAATLKHELKHVKTFERTYKDELPTFRKYLNKSARALPAFPPMNLPEINIEKQKVIQDIKNDLQDYLQIIEQEVELHQRDVDSKEEYDSVWERCDRWDRK